MDSPNPMSVRLAHHARGNLPFSAYPSQGTTARSQITIECPDEILQILQETPETFAREARVLLAAKLYETGRLTSGQAARFAGLGRVSFLDTLKTYQVSVINLSREELEKDFRSAGNL